MAHILLVDDDEALMQLIGEYLIKRKHTVTRCSDPTQATGIVEQAAPDLAVLDYAMPILLGPALLTKIRNGVRGKCLPVIFLSGVEAPRYAMQVPPDPLTRFLQKPAKLNILDETIGALLDPEGWPKNL